MAKITNEEKYKTPEERARAYARHEGLNSNQMGVIHAEVVFNWLASEAPQEADLVPCPFCGSTVSYCEKFGRVWCRCDNVECRYMSGEKPTEAEAIAAHNRVARAIKAAKESEVK